ncbi:energy transducer TonB [Bacteroides sp. 519]|uniref:energy transducer TonB n=1 Tax=Bacteroides sp. 519 TaxID=2302937 RepID=UPI0013D5C43A|nr:energy transducer TonB [Bacteroides sp. 519]
MKIENFLIVTFLFLSLSVSAQQEEPVVSSSYNSNEDILMIILTNPTDKKMIIHNSIEGPGSIIQFQFLNDKGERFGFYDEVFSPNWNFPKSISINPRSNIVCKYKMDDIRRGTKRITEIRNVIMDCIIAYSIPDKKIYGVYLNKSLTLKTRQGLSIGFSYDSPVINLSYIKNDDLIRITISNPTDKRMFIHNSRDLHDTSQSFIQFRFINESGEIFDLYTEVFSLEWDFPKLIEIKPHSNIVCKYRLSDIKKGTTRKSEVRKVEAECYVRYSIPEKDIMAVPFKEILTVKTTGHFQIGFSIDSPEVLEPDSVDICPQFPGGYDELQKFLKNNTIYEPEGERNPIIVGFIVEKDGITNPLLMRSIDPYLDREALRLVSIMPKWEPGCLNGTPVRVQYRVLVYFGEMNTLKKER